MKTIANICWWIIRKIEGENHIKTMRIDDKEVTIRLQKYLPNDDEWHNFVATTSFWFRAGEHHENNIDEVAVWVDGGEVARYLLNEKQHEDH